MNLLIKRFLNSIALFLFLITSSTNNYASSRVSVEDIHDNVEARMPFKLGFEFQEGNSLCSWASNVFSVQKKSLFKVTDNTSNRYLWKVVIDTSDIEFVTIPFTHTESTQLERCMELILLSLNTLRNCLNEDNSITFKQWTDALESLHIEHAFTLTYKPIYDNVKGREISHGPKPWRPVFAPQVTIQHPLEYTIPLYFSLFGFKHVSYMAPFVAAIPFSDLLVTYYEEGDSSKVKTLMNRYTHKLSGLTFLHALTVVQMTPNEDMDDSMLIKETLECLTKFQQIDPKMKLTLMSRRPFSAMFEDLNLDINYTQFFATALSKNKSFW